MSESKHTPGPWAYKNNNHYYDIGLYNEDVDIIHPTTCMGVQHNQEANARLIASSPELLEALESIENDDGHIPEKIWAMRNAAIAKARGEDA